MAILKIKVQPGASKNEISGMYLDMLKVKVTTPPEGGKANKTCIELLAKELGIHKSTIKLIKGHTSREKQVLLEGLTNIDLADRLKSSCHKI